MRKQATVLTCAVAFFGAFLAGCSRNQSDWLTELGQDFNMQEVRNTRFGVVVEGRFLRIDVARGSGWSSEPRFWGIGPYRDVWDDIEFSVCVRGKMHNIRGDESVDKFHTYTSVVHVEKALERIRSVRGVRGASVDFYGYCFLVQRDPEVAWEKLVRPIVGAVKESTYLTRVYFPEVR